MEEFKCSRCEKSYDSYDSLRKHSVRTHKINAEQFHIEYNLNGIPPTCACGCGEKVRYIAGGFKEYVKGHYSRVHNNWGHNPKAIENSTKTRQEQFKNGERTVWNKGLTIEDPRVKANHEKAMASPHRNENISKALKQLIADGKLIIPKGKDHPMYGHVYTDETRKKMSVSALKRMKFRNRVQTSKLEELFEIMLKQLDIKFVTQYPAYDINAFYDFKIDNTNILIETDGDFYHCNPNTVHKIPKYEMQFKNLKKEIIKNEWAKDNGYKLLRFWESDIKNNQSIVLETLMTELKMI